MSPELRGVGSVSAPGIEGLNHSVESEIPTASTSASSNDFDQQ
jgi:hypothetical protein